MSKVAVKKLIDKKVSVNKVIVNKGQRRTPRSALPFTARPVALHNQLSDPDGFYEALLDAHEGRSLESSAAFNARLILILANQIGDQAHLVQCLALAKD